MAGLRLSDQRRAAQQFWASEIKNLEAATQAVTKGAARALRRDTMQELKRFKQGRHGGGAFHKAIKVYDLPAAGVLGPASYVRLGVPFIGVFQEGETVQGKPILAILLDTGAALGFRRITKGNTWKNVVDQMQRRFKGFQVFNISGGRRMVAVQKDGAWMPLYLFQQQVKDPKKLSFYEMAEDLADRMPEQIDNLMQGKLP